jgi:hypothetical protein
LGPAGLAAGAALGALAIGFKAAADAALAMGQRAGALRDMNETVGLSVESLQALQIAAGRTGVSSEQLTTGIEKFSASLSEIREQSGAAFEALERINPALARQAAGAATVEDAFAAISEALKEATKEDANFAAKSIFGKGGIGMVRVIKEMSDGLEDFTQGVRNSIVITEEMSTKWDDLSDSISENMRLSKETLESIVTESMLEILEKASEAFLDMSQAIAAVDWDAVTTGISSTVSALTRLVPILNTVATLWRLLPSAKDVPGMITGATGSPAGLPGGNPAGPPASGSAAGLPDPKTLEAKYKDLNKTVKQSGKDALDFADILKANVSALGDAATEAERYQSKLADLAKKLQEGTISQDTFNRAVSQLNPAVVTIKEVAGDLGKALSSAFINGQSAAEALNNSLKSLATTASGKAFDKLITGLTGGGFDLPSIATSGLVAVGATLISKLFGGDKEDQQRQQQAAEEAERKRVERENEIAEAQIRAADYTLRAAEAIEKSDFINQVRRFDAESQKAFDVESKRAGDVAIWQLVAARAAERTKLISDTIDAATATLAGTEMSEVQTRLKEISEAAKTLSEALIEQGASTEAAAEAVNEKLNPALDKLRGGFLDTLTQQVNELAGGAWINQAVELSKKVQQMRADAAALGVSTALIDSFFVLSAQKIVDGAKLAGDSFSALERMLGLAGSGLHEFAAAVEDVAAAAKRSTDEIQSTIQGYRDQLFTLQQDQNTLGGSLAVFNLTAQRAREEEIKKGGEALTDLEALQAQQRFNIINDFNQRALDAQKQAADEALRAQQAAADEQARIIKEAQDFLEGSLRRIQDWIAHFQASTQSNLSPSAQLAAAQSAFQTQRTQALGGNRDALTNITGYAQDVVDAVRRYYGSGAAGQTIVDQLIGQLQALPTQVSAEQFIVDGVTDSITSQTDTLSDELSLIKFAVQSGDAQAVATALAPYFNNLDINTDGLLDFNEFQQGLAGMASNAQLRDMFTRLDTDASGGISRLELINQSLGGGSGFPGNQLPAIGTNTGTTASETASIDTKSDRLGFIDNNTNTAALQLVTANNTLSTSQSILATVRDSTSFLNSINNNIITMTSTLTQLNNTQTVADSRLAIISGWAAGSNHAQGGWITGGTSGRDSVRANLTPGEFVVREPIARNNPWLADFNSTGIMPMYGAANDNGSVVMAIQTQTVVLMRGIAALIQAELQAAGIISRPIEEANKLQRTRRGEKKAA